MKRKCLVALFIASLCPPVFSQNPKPFFETSFSAALRVSGGAASATLFLRPAIPLIPNLFIETPVALDYEKRTAAFFYALSLRKDWPQPKWTPFLLAGGGAETQFTGPFSETKPLFHLGCGGLFPLGKTTFIRTEYQFQKFKGNLGGFTRHMLIFGVQVRWEK